MQQPGYNVPHTQVRGEPMQSPEDVAAMLRSYCQFLCMAGQAAVLSD